jgi:hypothetical protein
MEHKNTLCGESAEFLSVKITEIYIVYSMGYVTKT